MKILQWQIDKLHEVFALMFYFSFFFLNMFNLTVILLCLFYYLLIIYHYIMYIVWNGEKLERDFHRGWQISSFLRPVNAASSAIRNL